MRHQDTGILVTDFEIDENKLNLILVFHRIHKILIITKILSFFSSKINIKSNLFLTSFKIFLNLKNINLQKNMVRF